MTFLWYIYKYPFSSFSFLHLPHVDSLHSICCALKPASLFHNSRYTTTNEKNRHNFNIISLVLFSFSTSWFEHYLFSICNNIMKIMANDKADERDTLSYWFRTTYIIWTSELVHNLQEKNMLIIKFMLHYLPLTRLTE